MVKSACAADSLDQLEFRVKSTGEIFGLSCVATTWPLLTIILPGLHFACQWPSSSSFWPRLPGRSGMLQGDHLQLSFFKHFESGQKFIENPKLSEKLLVRCGHFDI